MISDARALVPTYAGPIVRHEGRRNVFERAATAAALVACVGAPLWLLSSALALGVATVAIAIALTLVIGLAGGDPTPSEEREYALAAANVSGEELGKLTSLVEQIARLDHGAVARYELEALLDRHVAVAIAHDRALRAAALANRAELERTREACARDGRTERLLLCVDQLRALDHCEFVAAKLADELATIAALIGAVAQWASCPDLPADVGVVERCTEELAATTAARAELDHAAVIRDR